MHLFCFFLVFIVKILFGLFFFIRWKEKLLWFIYKRLPGVNFLSMKCSWRCLFCFYFVVNTLVFTWGWPPDFPTYFPFFDVSFLSELQRTGVVVFRDRVFLSISSNQKNFPIKIALMFFPESSKNGVISICYKAKHLTEGNSIFIE